MWKALISCVLRFADECTEQPSYLVFLGLQMNVDWRGPKSSYVWLICKWITEWPSYLVFLFADELLNGPHIFMFLFANELLNGPHILRSYVADELLNSPHILCWLRCRWSVTEWPYISMCIFSLQMNYWTEPSWSMRYLICSLNLLDNNALISYKWRILICRMSLRLNGPG